MIGSLRPVHLLARLALAAFLAAAAPWAAAQGVVRSIALGNSPRAIAVNPVTNRVYVANEFSNTVSVIDPATGAATQVAVGTRPQYIAVNTRTNRIYVASGDSSQTVIDGATLATITLHTGSSGPMVVSEATDTVYMIRLGLADEVTRIRGDNTYYTMGIDSYSPVGMALDERANRLWVVSYATGDAKQVDLDSTSDIPPTRGVPVWGHPVAIAFNPATQRAYVIGEDSRGPINVVDTANFTAVYYTPAGHARGPRAIAVNTVTNKVYAAFQGEVMVMDGATAAMTFIPAGDPVGIVVNERTNKIYVADARGSVMAIDGATNVVTNVGLGGAATAIALNPLTNQVFVTAGALAVIDAGAAPSAGPPPAPPAPARNVQGLWWRGASESGWGINLTQQGDTLFATWFTYGADASGQWFVMSNGARTADNTWSGTLYRATGPAFNATFDPARVSATPVGTATFTFSDADHGTFSATVDGTAISRPITREIYASPAPACAVGGAVGPLVNYQDLWWRTSGTEAGWGLNITHQGDVLFVTWFTYGSDGRGMWLVAPNTARAGNGMYAGTLYRTWGPPFDMQPWNPANVRAMPVGSISLVFTDAANGTMTASVDGVTVTKPISRETFATPTSVCH